MAFCSNCWLLRDVPIRGLALKHNTFSFTNNRKVFVKMPPSTPTNRRQNPQPIRCEKKKKGRSKFDPAKIEPPPYEFYMDSTSGQMEPASGARASIPDKEYWPEGTQEQVRAAQAPPPVGESKGSPSFGKAPGSRRSRRYNAKGNGSESEVSDSAETSDERSNSESETSDSEPSQISNQAEITKMPSVMENGGEEYVVYKTEEEKLTGFDLDKEIGNPHPFINPAFKKIEGTLPNDDLWWNWRKEERWSRWQKRRPDVETVFAKAMAQIGQIKLFGEEPSVTETNIVRARRRVFKEERLKAEEMRLKEIGPVAYYSEWVSAYKDVDTSREAVQRRYEKTGLDEDDQLLQMFAHQTDGEYRIMVGLDVRIKRDPLAMRMPEELIKEIWGGDPVHPPVNYYRDPDEVIDYRGPDFHEHIPNIVTNLLATGRMIPADEFDELMADNNEDDIELSEIDQAISSAVDIGELEIPEDNEDDVGDSWSLVKTSPHIEKTKDKVKKEGQMTLKEAIKDSENLTDFIMDFEGGSEGDE